MLFKNFVCPIFPVVVLVAEVTLILLIFIVPVKMHFQCLNHELLVFCDFLLYLEISLSWRNYCSIMSNLHVDGGTDLSFKNKILFFYGCSLTVVMYRKYNVQVYKKSDCKKKCDRLLHVPQM